MNDSLTQASENAVEAFGSIYAQQVHVRQHDLARVVGFSRGLTNAIVKRLVQKGWLKVRKVNNRNIRYPVSAAGVEQYVVAVKQAGYRGMVLVGMRDLDFIIEHACERAGIDFLRRLPHGRRPIHRVRIVPLRQIPCSCCIPKPIY